MLIKCPNPECGKRIPSYSIKCEYCNTSISAKDIVPIESTLPEDNKNSRNTLEAILNENRDYLSDDFSHTIKQRSSLPIAYPELVPFSLSGVIHGSIGLTPEHVRVKSFGPSIFSTHATFKVDPHKRANPLYKGPYNLMVYKGGLIFPEHCPVTMDSPDHVEIFETFVSKRGLGKVEFMAKPKLKMAITTALCCDRYWFAIPFSKNHGRNDRAIGFQAVNNTTIGKAKSVITIKNRAYAQEFAKLNHLENGRWISKKYKLITTFGFFAFAFGLGILAITIFLGESGNGIIESNSIAIFVMILLTLTGLASVFYGSKGEKL